MRQANAISEQLFLNEHGDNLSAWLLTLQTRYRDEYTRLEQAVKDILPNITSVLTPPTQVGTTFVLLKEKFLKKPTNLWRMSDGTLQFLALLSLIFAPAELGAPLFCIEEPENHLHPKLMESLIELLNQRQQEFGPKAAQVMIATHYPYLIDMVSLDELIAVVKSGGATTVSPPHREKISARSPGAGGIKSERSVVCRCSGGEIMFKFGLILEGFYDEQFLRHLIGKIFSGEHQCICRIAGGSRLINRFPGFLEEFRYLKVDKALIIRDQNHKCRKELIKEMRGKISSRTYPFPVKFT